ncbi:MAG: hypothetical protein KF762_12660 [Acidobacteria bacterium]|nr:hypothetical protein [Acidobacteriota bacterium]
MVEAKNPKEMNYDPLVKRQVEIINAILSDCGAPEIFDNPDITFDEWWIHHYYLKFKLMRVGHNSIMLDFHLQADGMRVDIETYDEAVEFDERDLLDESKGKKTLQRLICGPVLIERKGGAMFVNLFNPDGSRYEIWAYQSWMALAAGGYWKTQTIDQHLFNPIYSQLK